MKKLIALSAVVVALTGCQAEDDDSTTQIPLGDGGGTSTRPDFSATISLPKEMTAGTQGDINTYALVTISDFNDDFEAEVFLSSSGEIDSSAKRIETAICGGDAECMQEKYEHRYCEFINADSKVWCTFGDTTSDKNGTIFENNWTATNDIQAGSTYIIVEACRRSVLIETENCTTAKGIINLY